MATLELPTRKDLPAYDYNIVLDGTTYILRFTFNDRMGKWFFSISDQTDTPIINPVPVVSDWDVVGRFTFSNLPLGTLIFVDTSGKSEDPGRFDLGDRVRLLYEEAL